MNSKIEHKPVLLNEVLKYVLPPNPETFADVTLGLAGHTKSVLEKYPALKVAVGIDKDGEILKYSEERCSDPRLKRFKAAASDILSVMNKAGLSGFDGILADLGVSSYQLNAPQRGFSFMNSGLLDMRMDQEFGTTAADLVNNLDEQELAKIFFEYGEEKFSRKIAKLIVEKRTEKPIKTTEELAQIAMDSIPAKEKNRMKIHPATKIFQALRIKVNGELDELSAFLPAALEALNPGGRLTVISFHSLEDRIVKHFFNQMKQGCVCPPKFPICTCGKKPVIEILTSKAVFAEDSEIEENPRARSARLRSCRKLIEAPVL